MTKKPSSSFFLLSSAVAVFSFLIILPGAATALASTNLISNPSFASSTSTTTPTSWNTSSWGDAAGAVFAYPVAGEDSSPAAQVSIASYKDAGENNGAAEWYFNSVPVTANGLYVFSDWYNSNTQSYLMAQWTLTDGTVAYDAIATLPSTNNTWVNTPQEVFTAPANAVSVTIFHQLQSAGTLTVDNYSLAVDSSPTSGNLSTNGLVSLTFDDGWTSQYTNALPILNAAHMTGTFYIITDDLVTDAANPNLFAISQVSTSSVTSTSKVTWSGLYTDPTFQQYIFSDVYTATAATNVTVSYTLNGTTTSQSLGSLPAATNGAAVFAFTLPTTGGNTVTPISVSQTLSGSGTLSASNPDITENENYMSPSQLSTFQGSGNEIASHTETHPDLTALSTAAATTEISGSRTALLSFGASPVTAFAYPFGNYSSSLEQLVGSAGYTSARSVDVGYNVNASNPLALKTYSVVEGTTFATVKSWIDTAAANKWWLILTFHEVDPAALIASNGEVYGTTPQIFQQIVSYLQTQNIPVKTVGAAMATMNGTTPPPPPPPIVTATTTLKVTIALSGGTTTVSNFNLTVQNGTSTLYHGVASSSNAFTLNVGTTYTVSEATTTNSSNYTIALSPTCSGTATSTAPITCSITNTVIPPVVVPVLKTITVRPAASALTVGATEQLTAKTLDQNGTSISATLKWSTSDATIASVSSTGLVTATGKGTATITASSGSISSSPVAVTVTASSSQPVVPSGTTSFVNGVFSLIGATNSNNTFSLTITGTQYYGFADNQGRVTPIASTTQIIIYAGKDANTITIDSVIKNQIEVILPTGAIQYAQPGKTVTIQG